MLSYTDLLKGTTFIMDGEPYEVLDCQFVRMQQRKPVVQARIRNLISSKVLPKTFHQSDSFQEANIEKREAIFVYSHREEYVFRDPKNPKNRFSLKEDAIGEHAHYLKQDLPVTIYVFNDRIINVALPIKVDYLVKDAPPSVRGDTATGGMKTIILENGVEINVPLFINTGDIIRINTETGEYVERMEKK